jgi:hypothetical protein
MLALIAERERDGTGEPAHTEGTRYVLAPAKVQAVAALAAKLSERDHKRLRSCVDVIGPRSRRALANADAKHLGPRMRMVAREMRRRSRHRGAHRPPVGRAPRRARNARQRGSRRASGIRTGQDPGEPDGESDSARLSPLLGGGAGR